MSERTDDGRYQRVTGAGPRETLARYWGKARPDVAGGPDHHTVLGHSLDVAASAYTLVQHHAALARDLAHAWLPPNLAAISYAGLCALHDVGKLDTRFQRKAPAVADVLRPESKGVEAKPYDHGAEGFRQLDDDDDGNAALLDELLGPDALALLRAVCGHHGTMPSRDDAAPNNHVPRRLREEDAGARRLFLQDVVAFFRSQGAALPWRGGVDGACVQRLAGLCAVADWIGSNTEHFAYAPGAVDMPSYWREACERAEVACGAAGLLRAPARSSGFAELFPGMVPRNVQTVTEAIALDEPALVIVEAEMGKGKTEAALSMAARFVAAHHGDGVTVALPTMATSNAMFERIEQVVPRLFAGDEVQLALAHGRASRQPRFQALVRRRLDARDKDAPEATVTCARWLLGRKRILLAQVGVGTIDQALQAALAVRHQFVRMFGLSRNVVIIDEVHAYDAYMEVLLEHLLSWLGALRVPVVLLSATLPSERRAALAAAWRGVERAPDEADALDVAAGRPYPLVSVSTASTTRIHSLEAPDATVSAPLVVERVFGSSADAAQLERTADRLLDAARRGARVVWIRNTVSEAQRAFRAVAARAGDIEHRLFHARFRACDRATIEPSVLRDFGKAAAVGGRVLIATQVVEQSLDLDFDEMHTDLAPIDLILQRAGRLHRHVRTRPEGFSERRLVVHVPLEADADALRFGPSRYVYDAGTLWLANRALRARSTLRLPDDIRSLVEEAYHPTSRAALLPLGGPALVAAEAKRADNLTARRTNARRCCIPTTTADPSGIDAMPDDDASVHAFTRDGVSTTLLPLRWGEGGARALDAEAGSAPWALDPTSPDAWRLTGDLLDQTLSLPARSDVEGVVASDASAWDSWRTRFARFADTSGLGRSVVPVPLAPTHGGFAGWMRLGRRRRRVLYTKTLGLFMPSDKSEEEQR